MISSDALEAYLVERAGEPFTDLPPVRLVSFGRPGYPPMCLAPLCGHVYPVHGAPVPESLVLQHLQRSHPEMLIPRDRGVMSV